MLSKIFKIEKNTITIIAVMVVIVIIGLVVAWNYYGSINNSEDPRVVKAKNIYKRYDLLASENSYTEILSLLDSMSNIYNKYDDYRNSYEMGVVVNNKVAVLITMALFETTNNLEKDSLLNIAKTDALSSISIYNDWVNEFGTLSENQIKTKFESIYMASNSEFEIEKREQYLSKRINDVVLAQKETSRRLSVSYTNLGIVCRHQENYEEAIKCYQKALELWSNNLTAQNNINILLGRPIKERSVLEKIFPENK